MLGIFDPFSSLGTGMLWLLVIVIIWSAIWKALALWRAARMGHVLWFIIFIVVNLLGIPEIIYLIVTQKSYSKRRRR